MTQENSVKHIVIVGDGRVGKTSLLSVFSNGYFEEAYEATIYDRSETVIVVDGEEHVVQLHDTGGQEEFENASRYSYKIAHAFILCYSIPERVSFENIELKWIPHIRSVNQSAPIILVGTKHDVKTEKFVSIRQGKVLKKIIKANKFIESSAKTQMNVEKVVHEAVRATVTGITERRKKWLCFC